MGSPPADLFHHFNLAVNSNVHVQHPIIIVHLSIRNTLQTSVCLSLKIARERIPPRAYHSQIDNTSEPWAERIEFILELNAMWLAAAPEWSANQTKQIVIKWKMAIRKRNKKENRKRLTRRGNKVQQSAPVPSAGTLPYEWMHEVQLTDAALFHLLFYILHAENRTLPFSLVSIESPWFHVRNYY